MATAAERVMDAKRHRIRRRAQPNLVVVDGGKELPADEGREWLLSASARFRSRQLERRFARVETLPRERRSIERAMLAVEAQFVKAVWVMQRVEAGGCGPASYGGTTGLSYNQEAIDRYAQALANGGWEIPPPRPALPSSREITKAEEAQAWVRFLDSVEARVLTVGALSKRGDAGRRVNWIRVKGRLKELEHYTNRHLQGIYTAALRNIVTELTAQKIVAAI